MKWKEASEVYAWLLGAASKYPSKSSIYRNAHPIAIQYLQARKSQSAIRHFHDWAAFLDYPDWRYQEEELSLRAILADQVGSSKVRYAHRPRLINRKATLHQLVIEDDVSYVYQFLENGIRNPNEADIRGMTPLHYACQHGHKDMAGVLLLHSAGVDAQSLDGSSPLHLAALNGHGAVVDTLMQSNLPTRLRDIYGRLPVHCAAMNGHVSLVERWIVDAKAPDGMGRTALHYAAWFGRTDVLHALLKTGRDDLYTIVDYTGYTPLHLAAKRGHAEVMEYLIVGCVNIHATGRRNYTPLHLAAEGGHRDAIVLITRKDPSTLKDRDSTSRTPLEVARHHGQAEVFDVLTWTDPPGGNPETTSHT
jgi:ankyrin repeat protein